MCIIIIIINAFLVRRMEFGSWKWWGEVIWYVDPPRGGGPRRIWPRFQCKTVNQVLTSKTQNFPNFYPLQYFAPPLKGFPLELSIIYLLFIYFCLFIYLFIYLFIHLFSIRLGAHACICAGVKKQNDRGSGRERSMTISSAVWIQYTNVTDRRTDRHLSTVAR